MVPHFLTVSKLDSLQPSGKPELLFCCLPVLGWGGNRAHVPCKSGVSWGAQVPSWLGMLWSWCYWCFHLPQTSCISSIFFSQEPLRPEEGPWNLNPDVSPNFGPDFRVQFKTRKDLAFVVLKGHTFHSVTTQNTSYMRVPLNSGWQVTCLGVWSVQSCSHLLYLQHGNNEVRCHSFLT